VGILVGAGVTVMAIRDGVGRTAVEAAAKLASLKK